MVEFLLGVIIVLQFVIMYRQSTVNTNIIRVAKWLKRDIK
jgi:hypothetical protein